MRRQELKERLPHPPAQTKRTLQVIYDIDTDGKRGQLGHHDYTDKELRLLKEWDRVNALLGAASRFDIKLRRRAVRMLAAAPAGYVWISHGRVGWSLAPPIQIMKQGAVCWPVHG